MTTIEAPIASAVRARVVPVQEVLSRTEPSDARTDRVDDDHPNLAVGQLDSLMTGVLDIFALHALAVSKPAATDGSGRGEIREHVFVKRPLVA